MSPHTNDPFRASDELRNLRETVQEIVPQPGDIPELAGIDIYGATIPLNGVGGSGPPTRLEPAVRRGVGQGTRAKVGWRRPLFKGPDQIRVESTTGAVAVSRKEAAARFTRTPFRPPKN